MHETSEHDPFLSIDDPAPGRRRRLWLLVIALSGLAVLLMSVHDSRVSAVSAETQDVARDLSKFSHSQTHAALPCLICHRGANNAQRPSLPGHTPCAGCHTQRFADPGSPMCTICHTDVQSGAVKAFPRLNSFNVRFDHARHGSGAARPGAGCTACHQRASGGVALSIPAGFSAHATCNQCHTTGSRSSTGLDLSSCGTCHSAGRYARTSTLAKAYKVNFSHARHSQRGALSCNGCHKVRAGMQQARQVSSPQPLMHHASANVQSCATCHNDKRAFGIESFADCKRCHKGARFYF